MNGIDDFCGNAQPILVIIGWVLTIFKVAIPLIIVAIGIFDLARASISTKPEDIKKSVTSLIWRLVGGAAIFLLPSIILMVFGWMSDFSEAKDEIHFDICEACLLTPWNDDKCYEIEQKN